MRSRRPSPEHDEAVARRLAALVAELEATRPTDPSVTATRADDQLDQLDQVQQVELFPQAHPLSGSADTNGDTGEDTGDNTGEDDLFDEVDDCEATVVRLPGRHAARRGDFLGDLDPDGDDLRSGRWGHVRRIVSGLALAPAHLAVVAALAAGALAVTCWWLVASDPQPQPVAAPVPVHEHSAGAEPGAASPAPGAAASPAPTEAGTAQVVVDVAGKVRRPGIAVLPAGSRVVDALEAAGGPRRGVDLAGLNLARLLVDGEQILVGVEPPPGVANGAVPGSGTEPAGLLNINQAGQAELETLPGVGPVTASAIIAWRTEHGGFRSVDDLLDVSGIGEATLAKLAPLVTL